MKRLYFSIMVLGFLLASGCSSVADDRSLYAQIGGQAGAEQLVDAFIKEIGNDRDILPYFKASNVSHFRNGFLAHLCDTLDGPCEYKGDTMVQIHTGMNINEKDFNKVVDLLINAMNEVGISHPIQNQILARMAPMRENIINI